MVYIYMGDGASYRAQTVCNVLYMGCCVCVYTNTCLFMYLYEMISCATYILRGLWFSIWKLWHHTSSHRINYIMRPHTSPHGAYIKWSPRCVCSTYNNTKHFTLYLKEKSKKRAQKYTNTPVYCRKLTQLRINLWFGIQRFYFHMKLVQFRSSFLCFRYLFVYVYLLLDCLIQMLINL